MQKITIIIILVIVLFSSLPVSSGVTGSGNTPSLTQYNLNFSTYLPGEYPKNLSWISFHDVNKSQYSTITTENSSFGTGLLVSSDGYNSLPPVYLALGMSLFRNFTVKITFTWRANNSFSQTGENIIFENSSNNILQYEFGSSFNYSLYLKGESNHEMGPEPPALKLYTLQISGSGQDGDIYTGITNGFNQTIHTPVLLKNRFNWNSNNYSILFGGLFSNLSLYNIYLSSSISGFSPLKRGNRDTFNETNITSVHVTGIVSNNTVRPLVDWEDNTLLYVSQQYNPVIYSYNFYNNTRTTLASFNGTDRLLATYSTTHNGYFLIGNGTRNKLEIYNYTDGTFSNITLYGTTESTPAIYTSARAIYVQDKNGSLLTFNTTSRKSLANFTYSIGGYPLETWAGSTSLYTEIYRNGSGSVSLYKVLPNGDVKNISTINLDAVDFTPVLLQEYSPELSSDGGLSLNGTYMTSFNFDGESTVPFVLDVNMSVIGGSGTYFFLKNTSGVYLQHNETIKQTNINAGAQYVTFNTKLTKGLSLSNDTISLYFSSGLPFSPDNISLNVSVSSILRGNVSIPYSVGSKVNYTVAASIANITLTPSHGYVNFSSSMLPNGSYDFLLKTVNIAGYSSTYEKLVSIDNFHPVLKTSPSNGTPLLEDSVLEFVLSDMSGTVHSSVYGPSNMTYSFSGYLYNITVPVGLEFLNLSVVVTDQFGMNYNFTFDFPVYAVNSSEYTSNIMPGSYLPDGIINLSWTPASFAVGYNVTLLSSGYETSLTCYNNYTNLDLESGHYLLIINATNGAGFVSQIVREYFTVQNFNPGLSVNRTSTSLYSFFGNSANDTLNLDVVANITSRFWLNATSPTSSENLGSGNGTYYKFTVNRNSTFFRKNGNYEIALTAMEESGRVSTSEFNISVNNTKPLLIRDNRTFYYNTTMGAIPLYFENDTSYSYSTGNSSNEFLLLSPIISLRNFSTIVTLQAKNIWGNSNQSSIRLVYSRESPEISLQLSASRLIWSRNLTLSYSVADPVGLRGVNLTENNLSRNLGSGSTGKVTYSFNSDGFYNFTLTATDICGNVNTSDTFEVSNVYFPQIQSIKPVITEFMGITHLSAVVGGKNLESVNLTWSLGGNSIGSGYSAWTYLMPGSHEIVLTLQYHGKLVKVDKQVFTLGFIPELSAFTVLMIILLTRKYRGKPDKLLSRELILQNLGLSLKELYSLGRKSGVRIGTISEIIREMQESDELVLMRDPDGVPYVMDPERRGK